MLRLATCGIALAALAVSAPAHAACPNASSTVTVPFPTGTADVTIYDDLCVALLGTDIQVHTVGAGGPLLNGSTRPAVTYDAAGFHPTANGAARGLIIQIFVVHVPSGKSTPMTLTVGAPVASVSTGTPTP